MDGGGLTDAVDPMMTIVPPGFIHGSAGWIEKRTPFAFVLKVWSHCASVIVPSGPLAFVIAFATTVSSLPCRAMSSLNAASMSESLETSATIPKLFEPSRVTASSSAPRRRPVRTTLAPLSMNSSAMPKPTPCAPPVMSATLPSSCLFMGLSLLETWKRLSSGLGGGADDDLADVDVRGLLDGEQHGASNRIRR